MFENNCLTSILTEGFVKIQKIGLVAFVLDLSPHNVINNIHTDFLTPILGTGDLKTDFTAKTQHRILFMTTIIYPYIVNVRNKL